MKITNNSDGDIRPGDYAFITDGMHEANKDHAFVMTNEHILHSYWSSATQMMKRVIEQQ